MTFRNKENSSGSKLSTSGAGSSTPSGWDTASTVLPSLPEYGFFAVIFLLFAGLGIASEGTFSDDDIGRFLAAQVVFEFPEKFVGLWTRPAAMLLYALPAQLGYWAIELLTAVVSTLTCFFVYRSARHLGEPRPHFAAIFTAVQPFFLLLSFSALTEPLAALLLAIAIERLLAGRTTSSAIWASLLPLARLEFSLVLGLWAIVLVGKRSWRAILWLPLGLVLWSVGAFLLTGDALFLIHSTFVERERGREAVEFWHYAKGSIFVLGPAVFFFAILGWVSSLRRPRYLLVWAAALGMIVYYTLSATRAGSLQSAGYLRHVVTLSPLFGLLALRGLNDWFGDRSGRELGQELGHEPGKPKFGGPQLIRIIVMLGIPLVCARFLSVDLLNRYILGDTPELWKLGIVSTLAAIGLLVLFRPHIVRRRFFRRSLEVGIVAISITYFFVTDGAIPLTNEKQVIRAATTWYEEEGLGGRTALCNHGSFHFFLGANPSHTADYPRLNPDNLEAAPIGSIVIWDGHYGHELAGGVAIEEMEQLRDYRVRHRVLGPKREFFAVILEKVVGNEAVVVEDGVYDHPGLGVHWDLGDSPAWSLRATDDQLQLMKARSTSGLQISVSLERFFRVRYDTESFGGTLLTLLERSPDFRVVESGLGPLGRWFWITGQSRAEDVLVGVQVAPERHAALKVVASGPTGSLEELVGQVPSLAGGLVLERETVEGSVSGP